MIIIIIIIIMMIAKLLWLEDPSELNGDNLNNVRCESSIYARNKKREHLKENYQACNEQYEQEHQRPV
jgi:hypothetical protein